MARTSKAEEEQQWAKAQRRCRLSDEALRMAKELGLNPMSLIKNIPSPKQQWKVSVEEGVREMYRDSDLVTTGGSHVRCPALGSVLPVASPHQCSTGLC